MKPRLLPLPSLLLLVGTLLLPARAQTFVPAPAPGSTNTTCPQTPPKPSGTPNGDQPGDKSDPKARMEERLHDRLEHLTKALNLTDDQQTEIAALFHKEGEELRDLFQNQDLSDDDKKAQFKEIREKFHAQIAALLTPEQQETFKQLPEHGPGGNGDNGPKPPPAS